MTNGRPQFTDWWQTILTSALLIGAMCALPIAASAEQLIEEVHTHVERPTEEVVNQSMTGQDIKKVEMQFHVRYDDLDLTTKDGVKALKKRVTKAALRGCADLGKRYGNLKPDIRCTIAAKKSARAQIDRAIEQARSIAALKDAELEAERAIAQTDSDK